jgi:hypothetical protein
MQGEACFPQGQPGRTRSYAPIAQMRKSMTKKGMTCGVYRFKTKVGNLLVLACPIFSWLRSKQQSFVPGKLPYHATLKMLTCK